MMMRSLLLATTLVHLGGLISLAQQPPADALGPLPTNPAQWVQSPPLSAEVLGGKGVVYYFYEEQCPRCREKWPGHTATAKKYEGQPVMFIAVNSGNPRPAVEQYLKQTQLTWPTIVDTDRKFEQALNLNPTISLQNIAQVRAVNGRGVTIFGNWEDLDSAAKHALEGSSWRHEGEDLPASIKPAWLAIEWGNYPAAAKAINEGLASANAPTKEGAQRLLDIVNKEIETAIEPGKAAEAAGKKWEAFRTYRQVSTQFSGFKMPEAMLASGRALVADKAVVAQMAAAKVLEASAKLLSHTSPAVRKRGVDALKKMIEQYPDTDAALEAATLVEGM